MVSPLAIANGTLRGILDSENCCIVAGRWSVDCGLGMYGGLWLVGKHGGEQLKPPSIALLSTPTSRRLLSVCLLYTSPSPRDLSTSRMPSSA